MSQIAHPPRYRPVTRDYLFVADVTASIQGEGPHLGRPVAVLQLMGCNLTCRWCDAAHTWDHRHYILREEGMRLTRTQVVDLLLAQVPRRLVITGGEPLLQSAALAPLIHHLAGDAPWRIAVETNGTLPPPSAWLFHVEQWTVSPKLRHSGNPAGKALNLPLLRIWAQLRSSIFQVVCKTVEDVADAAKLTASCGVPPERVWIVPEGLTTPVQLHRLRRLAPAALAQGFNLSPRLQVLAAPSPPHA